MQQLHNIGEGFVPVPVPLRGSCLNNFVAVRLPLDGGRGGAILAVKYRVQYQANKLERQYQAFFLLISILVYKPTV